MADWSKGITQGSKYLESTARNKLKRLIDAIGTTEEGKLNSPSDLAGVVNEYFAAGKDKQKILEAADAAVAAGKLPQAHRKAIREGFSAAERTSSVGDEIAAYIDDALPARLKKVDTSSFTPQDSFFELSKLGIHPKESMGTPQRSLLLPVSKQFDMDEFTAGFTPERVRAMHEAAIAGGPIGGPFWYNMAPIQQKMVQMFGPEEGQAMFRNWAMDNAVLSPRSGVVDQTIRESQLNHFMDKYGRWPTNKDMKAAPDMYGHLAHDVHLGGLNSIRELGGIPKTGSKPKVGSYIENYFGNWDPGTMDTHHFAIAGLSESNPTVVKTYDKALGEWKPKLDKEGNVVTQMVSAPIGKFYQPLELATRQLAARHGLDPAAEQASVWTGLALRPELLGGTTKKFVPRTSEPYAAIFDRVIRDSADIRGKSAEDMFRDAMLREDYFTRSAGAAKTRTNTANALEDLENFAAGGLAKYGPKAIRAMSEFVEGYTPTEAPAGALGVIKNRGGNWDERTLKSFADRSKISVPEIDTGKNISQLTADYIRMVAPEIDREYNQFFNASRAHSMDYAKNYWPWMQENHPELLETLQSGNTWPVALNKFVDRIPNYVKGYMGTKEDPIRLGIESFSQNRDARLAPLRSAMENAQQRHARAAATHGGEHYATRTAAEVQQAKDRLALEEARTGLHFKPEYNEDAYQALVGLGDPDTLIGKAPLARAWENASDSTITKGTYRGFVPEYTHPAAVPARLEALGGEFAVKNPDAEAHRFAGPSIVGFDHLIDELKNASRADSDLPDYLRLNVKQLNALSMPQAVEHVDKINAYRAVEMKKAKSKLNMNPATFVHKEYPDEGFKWVELKQPKELPEGWKPHPDEPTLFSMPDGSPTMHDPREKALADALKFEGDTMGHCVGGYCDEVASGRSKIYSLRDADGNPTVTIEVEPGKVFDVLKNLTNEEMDAVRKAAGSWADDEALMNAVKQVVPEKSSIPLSIVQIKGPQNQAPDEKTRKYIQDFLNSGEWSEVGDLKNTGLRRVRDVWNDRELQEIEKAGIKIDKKYMTPEELNEIDRKAFYGNPESEYFIQVQNAARRAEGGIIDIDAILDKVAKKYAAGGLVSDTPGTSVSDDMIAGLLDRAAQKYMQQFAPGPV